MAEGKVGTRLASWQPALRPGRAGVGVLGLRASGARPCACRPATVGALGRHASRAAPWPQRLLEVEDEHLVVRDGERNSAVYAGAAAVTAVQVVLARVREAPV